MMIEETEKIGKLFFEVMWSKPDLTIADEIVDPKYNPTWIQIDKTGPAKIKHEITYFRNIFPDLFYRIVEMKGEIDKVWIRYTGNGTHLGKGWGFEATKKKITFEGATILYINTEGKIYDQWGAFCLFDIFYDLGLVPPFWELFKYFPK
ncbi:MAG: ester cyclase [Promethearchaeota archaeon]